MITLHHQIAAWANIICSEPLPTAIRPPRLNSGQGTKGRNLHLICICFVGKQCDLSVSKYTGMGEQQKMQQKQSLNLKQIKKAMKAYIRIWGRTKRSPRTLCTVAKLLIRPLIMKIWVPSIRTYSLGMASDSPKQILDTRGREQTVIIARLENYKVTLVRVEQKEKQKQPQLKL